MKKTFLFFSIFGITFIFFLFFLVLLSSLIIFDFFGTKLTKEKVIRNIDFSSDYLSVINERLKDGYVPLQRILYFYLEDKSINIDTLYFINQDSENKSVKDINLVCSDERLKKYNACDKTSIDENIDYLTVSSKHFNFPLDKIYQVTSFFNEQRIIYNEENFHSGWDFAAPAGTKVYSVCSGVVHSVNFTQGENVPYSVSGNKEGNSVMIKCNDDYYEDFYVIYAHLYPNSSKVKVGDKVNHWTEIASVGTTGYSTGNHLHYGVYDSNFNLLDGMMFINFSLKKIDKFEPISPEFNF